MIATGFDDLLSRRSSPATAPMQTPVDLQSYTTHVSAKSVAGGAGTAESGASSRLTIARRPGLDLPLPSARMATMGAAGADSRDRSDAESEVNPEELDVPAFLRRSEA